MKLPKGLVVKFYFVSSSWQKAHWCVSSWVYYTICTPVCFFSSILPPFFFIFAIILLCLFFNLSLSFFEDVSGFNFSDSESLISALLSLGSYQWASPSTGNKFGEMACILSKMKIRMFFSLISSSESNFHTMSSFINSGVKNME